jgi:capsule polysaccharide export protein KpsC/LpsZ
LTVLDDVERMVMPGVNRKKKLLFIAQKQLADDAAIWYGSVHLMVPPD